MHARQALVRKPIFIDLLRRLARPPRPQHLSAVFGKNSRGGHIDFSLIRPRDCKRITDFRLHQVFRQRLRFL